MNHLTPLNDLMPGIARDLRIAGSSDMTVLILGPTGAGKSTVARKLHSMGKRSGKPFVSVNLATLHDGTFESELFGHEKGAFTGADGRRVGRMELAQSGTLFLDEVGEMPLPLQGRLLECLQSKVITPVGGNREIPLNVRIIAATNRDLLAEVNAGRFREDLYHRLQVLSIAMPSLTQLAEHFDEIVHGMLEELCREHGRKVHKLSEEVAVRLERHQWPGNYRELRNVLEYCVLASDGPEIQLADLPNWFGSTPKSPVATNAEGETRSIGNTHFRMNEGGAALFDYTSAMYAFERDLIGSALECYNGKVSLTSRRLSMSKTTLLRRMQSLGLKISPEGDVIRTSRSVAGED